MKLWEKVDCVILRNFHYHFKDPTINKYLESEISEDFEGYLILFRNKKPIWISHPFNYTQIKKKLGKKAIVKNYQTKKDIESILKKNCGKKIGYNGRFLNSLSLVALKKLLKGKKFIDVSEELENEREVKTKNEINNLRKATIATKKIIEKIKKQLKKGISEKEVENKIKQLIEEKNKKEKSNTNYSLSFSTIAFGKNTSNIHYTTGKTKLSCGAVLFDIGLKYDGYSSDISDSFWFGEKTGKDYEMYLKEKTKVENAIKEIEKILKEGTKAKDLYLIAKKSVGALPHAIGHGIGVEVHDQPAGIGEKSNFLLKERMVLAIEPAIYKKEFGIRIENNYLITKKGFTKL